MQNEQLLFSLGSDPEFFFQAKGGGPMVSAIPLIAGTKEEPLDLPYGGNVQRDNVAVEIGTDVVLANDPDAWIMSIHQALRGLHEATPSGLELAVVPSATFPADQLEHEEAKRFGCDPDFCAWKVAQNDPPMATESDFRSCGGHVHVGGMDLETGDPMPVSGMLLDFEGKLDMVKAMDTFHGTLFTILDVDEAAVARRKLYGNAGCHRPTPYGIEYRSLSNFWMRSPYTAKLIQEVTNDVLHVLNNKALNDLINAIGGDEIQKTINTGDADAATKIMETHLWPFMSDTTRFFFNRSLAKLKADDLNFTKEWADWAAKQSAMFV